MNKGVLFASVCRRDLPRGHNHDRQRRPPSQAGHSQSVVRYRWFDMVLFHNRTGSVWMLVRVSSIMQSSI